MSESPEIPNLFVTVDPDTYALPAPVIERLSEDLELEGGGGGGGFSVAIFPDEAAALAALADGDIKIGDVVGIEQT